MRALPCETPAQLGAFELYFAERLRQLPRSTQAAFTRNQRNISPQHRAHLTLKMLFQKWTLTPRCSRQPRQRSVRWGSSQRRRAQLLPPARFCGPCMNAERMPIGRPALATFQCVCPMHAEPRTLRLQLQRTWPTSLWTSLRRQRRQKRRSKVTEQQHSNKLTNAASNLSLRGGCALAGRSSIRRSRWRTPARLPSQFCCK